MQAGIDTSGLSSSTSGLNDEIELNLRPEKKLLKK